MKRSLPLIIALFVVAPVGTLALAADPDNGRVGPGTAPVTWDGKHYRVAATVTNTANPAAACPPRQADPSNTVCDYFTVDVAVPEGFYDANSGGASISITWESADDDFDLYVFDADGNLAGSSAAGGTTVESVSLPDASGKYEARIVPFLVEDTGYAGVASFASTPGTKMDPLPVVASSYRSTTVLDEGTAEDPEPLNPTVPLTEPALKVQSVDVGREAAEPTIGVDKQGIAYYAAGAFDSLPQGSPRQTARTELYRSKDGGKTWEDITNNLGRDSSPTTLDPYVYLEEDSGRLFNLDLLLAGAFIARSDDQGETFSPSLVTGDPLVNDHQTIFAGPVPAGFPFPATDPAFPEFLYYCFNRVADSACQRSMDGGQTWVRSGEPAFLGLDPAADNEDNFLGFCGGLHGHITTDKDGRIFLPKGHCGRPWVAISEDAGTTWERVQVAADVSMLDNQSAVATDDEGNVYYVWYDGFQNLPYLAVSTDHGKTWGPPQMIAPPGVHEVNWPTVAAGAAGRIVVTFPGTTSTDTTDLSRPWDMYVVTSTDALSPNPTFQSTIANVPGDPMHRGECDGRCGNVFDFLDVVVAPTDGGTVWGTAVDTCTELKECSTVPAPGYDGNADGVAADMRGIAFRQVAGPQLRPPPAVEPPLTGTGAGAVAPPGGTSGGGGTGGTTQARGGRLAATGPILPAGIALALLAGAFVLRRRRDSGG